MENNENAIICIDFDGTCVTHEYPDVGEDIGAVPILKKLVANGHRLILYTMRGHKSDDGRDALKDATDWFAKNGIELYDINKNPTQETWTVSPKVYADIYIDDAALGAPLKDNGGRPYVDWAKAEDMLRNRGLL